MRRVNKHAPARGQHGAEHVDQADDGGAETGDVAADLIQHPQNRHRRYPDGASGFDPAHFVDQARIIRRQACDLRLHPALGQAAAQSFDQPGSKGIEL